MDALSIQCPHCSQPLLLPAEMAGKLVKCPGCKSTFPTGANGPIPPARAASPAPQSGKKPQEDDPWLPKPWKPSRSQDESRRRSYDDDDDVPRSRSSSRRDRFDRDGYDDPTNRISLRNGKDKARNDVAGPAIALIVLGILEMLVLFYYVAMSMASPGRPSDRGFSVLMGFIAIIISVLLIAGGVAMRSLRSYGLAMTASIVALIPCTLCFVGIPFGIWSISTLSNSDVKNAFE